MSYTKNEIALETMIDSINKTFYYIGSEDDVIPDTKEQIRNDLIYIIERFINEIEVEEVSK
tara:strand:- start:446 stop:628 length:183 start_codon:yes stop_codon:yes gene_type:complete